MTLPRQRDFDATPPRAAMLARWLARPVTPAVLEEIRAYLRGELPGSVVFDRQAALCALAAYDARIGPVA